MRKIKLISCFAILMMVTIPAFALSACSATSNSKHDDKTNYNAAWIDPPAGDLTKKPSSFSSSYVWDNWVLFGNGDASIRKQYVDQYKIPEIILDADDANGLLGIQIIFDEHTNIIYNAQTVTSMSVQFSGFSTNVVPPVVTYNFNWVDPSPADLQLHVTDKTFDSAYIIKNWINIDSSYFSDGHKITIKKTNVNDALGSMDVTAIFDTDVLVNGSKNKTTTTTFNHFKKTNKYNFNWVDPSPADLQLHVIDKTFDSAYIIKNWINIDSSYISDGHKITILKTNVDDNTGSLDITAKFDIDVLFNGAKVNSVTKTFSGFKVYVPPVINYNFNWVDPSPADLNLHVNDPKFDSQYIINHWINIDAGYLSSGHKLTINKNNIDDKNGSINIEVSFDIPVNVNGSLIKSTNKTFNGFAKTQPVPVTYVMGSIQPSSQDKKNKANDSIFDATYALNHWINLDTAYTSKYSNPTVNLSSDASKGTIDMNISFAQGADVTFNNVKHTTNVTVNFTGFYITPVVVNNYFKYNSRQIPTSSYMKSQVDQMSLQNKIDNFIVFPSDSSLKSSDISNITITTSGQVGQLVNANLTVSFNKNVHYNAMTSAEHKQWSMPFTLIPTVQVTPHLKFLNQTNIDKNQMPSQITEAYIYDHIINIVDDNGNKLNPATYVKKLVINPNDEGGFLVLSVVFNQLVTRIAPTNCAATDAKYYQAPSYYFNSTISNFKTNGKPYYAASGYITDTSVYPGRHSFNLSDMDVAHHNNYNDYILAFMAPDTNGNISWWDVGADFNSTGLAQPVPGTEYRPQMISGKTFHPGMQSFMRGSQTISQSTYNGGMVGQLNAVKSYTGSTIGFSIGGATLSSSFSGIVASASLRSNLITNIIHIVEANGFDSIDIDWEYPYASDKENLVTFMKELRATFDANVDPDVQNTKITLAMTDDPSKITDGIDGAKLMKYIDYFHVMTYDMHGTWAQYFGEQAMLYADAPLIKAAIVDNLPTLSGKKPDGSSFTYHINEKYYTTQEWNSIHSIFPDGIWQKPFSGNDSMIQLEAMGVPSNQITIGAAFYGRGWEVTPNIGSPVTEIPGYLMKKTGTATGDWGQQFGSYAWIMDQVKTQSGWQLVKNYVTQTSWYYNKSRGIIWSTDTPWSLTNKINFIKKQQLGGILVWEMAGEWDGNQPNLDMSDQFSNNLAGVKNVINTASNDINVILPLKKV